MSAKAWVLNAKQADPDDWEVSNVTSAYQTKKGLLEFKVVRSDGSADHFLVRENKSDLASIKLKGEPMKGYVNVVRLDDRGQVTNKLDIQP